MSRILWVDVDCRCTHGTRPVDITRQPEQGIDSALLQEIPDGLAANFCDLLHL